MKTVTILRTTKYPHRTAFPNHWVISNFPSHWLTLAQDEQTDGSDNRGTTASIGFRAMPRKGSISEPHLGVVVARLSAILDLCTRPSGRKLSALSSPPSLVDVMFPGNWTGRVLNFPLPTAISITFLPSPSRNSKIAVSLARQLHVPHRNPAFANSDSGASTSHIDWSPQLWDSTCMCRRIELRRSTTHVVFPDIQANFFVHRQPSKRTRAIYPSRSGF
jgi:hypothetical protein